jgi:polyvinyl alcohol dehydrogenase (cytochrome)
MKGLSMGLRPGMLAIMLGMLAFAPAALAQQAPNTPNPGLPGKAIYDRVCATCHANPGQTRAATFGQITGTAPPQLRFILTEGPMKPMASGLSADELTSLIGYLTSGQKAVDPHWTDSMMCAPGDRAVDTSRAVAFGGFGVDPHSTRSLSARQSGLKKADMAHLQVAWAIGFPQTQGLGTGAVVLGDTVYLAAAGKLLALDADKGCARWAKTIVSRNTPQIATLGGRKVLVFAAGRTEITVVDAGTGDTVWTADASPKNVVGAVRGGVAVFGDKVIVPISSSGVGAGQNPKFECCIGHGAVVALALKDGKRLWEYHTMGDPDYNGQVSSIGVKQRGPSGAPIWGLPTWDETRGRIIVGTGENTSHPVTPTSDAIIALDLETGKQAWLFQALPHDVWNMSCNDRDMPKSGPNCPVLFGGEGRDFDFGATPMLIRGVSGKDIVFDGQKSGHIWALDAATGRKLWSDRIGEGTTLGGVHWGVATDGKVAYVPVADSLFTPEEQATKNKAGVYAYRLSDGKRLWSYAAKADCAGPRKAGLVYCETKYGFSAAPLLIDGVVVAGTLDGKVLALDARTGAVLTSIDTSGPQKTVNGVPGHGGSIDAHAITAGDGMIFVTSGYGAFSQTPGNVLIALKPGGK